MVFTEKVLTSKPRSKSQKQRSWTLKSRKGGQIEYVFILSFKNSAKLGFRKLELCQFQPLPWTHYLSMPWLLGETSDEFQVHPSLPHCKAKYFVVLFLRVRKVPCPLYPRPWNLVTIFWILVNSYWIPRYITGLRLIPWFNAHIQYQEIKYISLNHFAAHRNKHKIVNQLCMRARSLSWFSISDSLQPYGL